MQVNKVRSLLKHIQSKVDQVGEDLNYKGEDWDRLLATALSAKDALEEIKSLMTNDLVKELMKEYQKDYKNYS
jgi:hypothetical protein